MKIYLLEENRISSVRYPQEAPSLSATLKITEKGNPSTNLQPYLLLQLSNNQLHLINLSSSLLQHRVLSI
jgi:hypothetical protein